ncbi:hypothetical protein DRH29_05140 [candidate division Kazan bacterium]|uniref:Uncharacterized protein n=1 Tax=candidate division Kazan bacterium TaxID=2202143 RepID=A0A420ZBB9_UNCK3|nr:MAG: hypothetical protein DRH29_05140 [candidate division Kazan bacterium]
MLRRITPISRVPFNKARDRLIRSGLTPHEAVWVLLHGDGEYNYVEKEKTCQRCQSVLRAIGLAELFMCNDPASEHYLHIFAAGHPACNRFDEARVAKKERRKACMGQ